MDEETLAEIEKNAREMHAEGEFITEWVDDVEVFVTDMLDLINAAYVAGFEAARYLGIQALADMEGGE